MTQVLAIYYDAEDVDVEQHFWQQLLLSVELDLRLRAAGDQEYLMTSHVPEKVAWDIALSKVWLSKMTLSPIDDGVLQPATTFHVTALTKDTQKDRLLSFARNMQWADMHNVECMLEEDSDGGIPLEFQNAYTSSWITGTILPGSSVCWLAMRCLIDCDPTVMNAPHGFDNMESNFGFQYGSCTYWYFENIVGKVMGASRNVNQDYGWVGPCIPSDDLSLLQTVLIHTEDVPVKTSKSSIQKLASRSAPLGPTAQHYPVCDYGLPFLDTTTIIDSVPIQSLAFTAQPRPSHHLIRQRPPNLRRSRRLRRRRPNHPHPSPLQRLLHPRPSLSRRSAPFVLGLRISNHKGGRATPGPPRMERRLRRCRPAKRKPLLLLLCV